MFSQQYCRTVVNWLCAPLLRSTWSPFKTYPPHFVVSLGKTLYGIFPYLAVLTSKKTKKTKKPI